MLCESVVAIEYDYGNTAVALPVFRTVAVAIDEIAEINVVRHRNVFTPFIAKLGGVVVTGDALEVISVMIFKNDQSIIGE